MKIFFAASTLSFFSSELLLMYCAQAMSVTVVVAPLKMWRLTDIVIGAATPILLVTEITAEGAAAVAEAEDDEAAAAAAADTGPAAPPTASARPPSAGAAAAAPASDTPPLRCATSFCTTIG